MTKRTTKSNAFSRIISALSDVDKRTLLDSVGIDLNGLTVHNARVEEYHNRRNRMFSVNRAHEPAGDIPSDERHSLRCSFCQGGRGRSPYFIKLSEPHVICEHCIETLIEGAGG
jgi:hypothetical protein